jgi:bacterioferritin (cytochrome b1)
MTCERRRYEETVAFLRGIHALPQGTARVLNLIRGVKVRTAADVNVLADLVAMPQAKLDLARHASDETQHAYLLLRRMHELDFRPFRLPYELDRWEGLLDRSRARDVKQVYAERGLVSDAELMELVSAAYITEKHSLWQLETNADALDGDPATRAVLSAIVVDERRHVAYLERWLDWFEGRFSRRAVAATRARLEEVSRQLDPVYDAALCEYLGRLAA